MNEDDKPDKKKIRRRDILEAAGQVFADNGYDKTTMDDIANLAGVSKGTLYLYFKNKRTLFLALYTDLQEEATEVVIRAYTKDGTPPERLQAMLKAMREMIANPEKLRLLGSLKVQALRNEDMVEIGRAMNMNYINRIENIIQQGIDEGYFRSVDAEVAAICIQSGAAGLIDRGFFHPEWNNEENLEFYIDLVVRGLRPDGGESHHE